MKTRMYFLVNQYMMGIQAGIQAGHAAVRLMAEHWDTGDNDPRVRLLSHWFTYDETFILLDGGYQSRMEAFVKNALLPVCDMYPYTKFHEEKDSLNGALTAVAFVLPDYIYSAELDKDGEPPSGFISDKLEWTDFMDAERNLIKELKSFNLKRG